MEGPGIVAGGAPIRVRPVELADAAALADIYNPEVLSSTVTFDLVPRTVAEQEAWIVEHSGPYPALAALTSTGKSPGQSPGQSTGAGESTGAGDELVGFASTSPYRPRPAYSTTVETSVYVRADHQGRGIGRLLMEQLVDAGVAHGFHSMVARIVGGHDASIRLHEKVGFRIVGTEIEIGRKFGKWLDVVVMQRML